jgi:hypothetical protein
VERRGKVMEVEIKEERTNLEHGREMAERHFGSDYYLL